MGQEDRSVMGGLTAIGVPPEHNVIVMEVTVMGPGYGECILPSYRERKLGNCRFLPQRGVSTGSTGLLARLRLKSR